MKRLTALLLCLMLALSLPCIAEGEKLQQILQQIHETQETATLPTFTWMPEGYRHTEAGTGTMTGPDGLYMMLEHPDRPSGSIMITMLPVEQESCSQYILKDCDMLPVQGPVLTIERTEDWGIDAELVKDGVAYHLSCVDNTLTDLDIYNILTGIRFA